MSDTEKSASSNNKFLKGTLILTVSSIVVKVIGSLNWIILSRVLGGEGIGLYQMGFPIYLMAITLSSAGIPVAISIITAEKLAQKDFLGAKRVFNVSLRLLFVTGLVFASALFFGAHWLIDNHWIRDSRAYYSIIALAPAVFFVTFLASFRGYLQGWQIMTPTAASEIVEQLMRVVTMIVFANMFMPHGLAYAAGGASMGAGVGAFCALLVLMWFYGRLKQKLKADLQQQNPLATRESARAIISRLLRAGMLPVVANLDLLIVPQRLEAAGFHISQATEFFGYLTGMAVPLINLATIFTAAMTISLVPAISESRALNDVFGIRAKTRTAFRVALIITCPCFVGMYFLAEKIAALIYNAPGAADAIQTMSVGILLLGLHQISTGILQGLGRTSIPVINMICLAAAVKVFLSWTLTAIPTLGIKGAAMATVVDFGLAAVLNMIFIYKYTGFALSFSGVFKPAVSAAAMGAAVYGLAVGGMGKDDLESLPFIGHRLLAAGQKLGYFR